MNQLDEAAEDGTSDILKLLERASEQLAIGEMVQVPNFDLFSVVSAVEIGDPRLDAGMKEHQPEGAAREADVPTELSRSQILGIMDTLFATEATWHQGSVLAQTVYTCYYLLHQERISHLTTLSAFCTAVKVNTQIVSDLVRDSGACEEEDFIAYMFGFQDSKGVADIPQAVAVLSAEEELLASASERMEKGAESQTLSSAMLTRLRFRRILLSAMGRLLKNSKQDVEAARKLLIQARVHLDRIQETSKLGDTNPPGFFPKINSHQMGPAPPRPVKLLSQEDTWKHYHRLLDELLVACDAVKPTTWNGVKGFMSAFSQKDFGPIPCSVVAHILGNPNSDASRPWTPCVPMLRVSMGLPKSGAEICPELNTFMDECSSWAKKLVRVLCQNRTRQRRQHRRSVEDWQRLLNSALLAEQTVPFKAWLSKSAWQWKPSPESRLEPQGPLSTWIEMECCLELLQHLLLGFELECYLPYEFCMIYWYCDYLYSLVVEDTNYLSQSFPRMPAKAAKGKAGKKTAPKTEEKTVVNPEALVFWQKSASASVEKCMCQALMRITAGLYLAGLLNPRPTPFNTEEQYYEQRFFIFTQLAAPAPLSYEDYATAMSLSDCTAMELMRNAAQNFHDARRHAAAILASYESWPTAAVEQVRVLDSLAKHNIVAIAILTKSEVQKELSKQNLKTSKIAGSAEAEAEDLEKTVESTDKNEQQAVNLDDSDRWKVTWDFSLHSFFPIIKLKK